MVKSKLYLPLTIYYLLLKLLQEANVVLEEESYVVELVHESAHAVYAEAEGEAGELFGVYSDRAQNVRVNHAGAAQFYPARALAESAARTVALEAGVVGLHARLCEREVGRAEARARLRAEEAAHELRERALQVAHVYAAVDEQPFDLEEHRVVCRVRRVAAEDPARRDDTQRRLTLLHRVNLHGGRLRAKAQAVRRVEGVLRRARGVQLGEVERGEVVEASLDFRAVFDRVAHRDEDVFDALAQERYRVKVAATLAASGQRHVKALALGLERVYVPDERDGHVGESAAYLLVELLHGLAEARALFGGHATDELHQLRDGA